MADEAGDGAAAPMVWALAVRATAAGPPFAELIVEIGPRLYGEFVESAVDSGFVLAAGEPPATTAVVGLRGDVLSRLVLVGGRQLWEPASEVRASPGWVAAAAGRALVVVLVVPPGTWPPDLMELDPAQGADVLGRSLEAARTSGAVLHGTAAFAQLGP
ncbi:hypothetical protein ABTX81_34970 [Kitasatospora sp. NPDC097605]|uniref:hypothetical protein n=1 Tax=Kitasatospora sp. NPDC097605 TaxID=3157226 RepID=UPI0033260597